MKTQGKKEMMDVNQIKNLIRGMMVTSPTPWTIQEKTGDIIDNNGRFVARVGWGIEKFKHPMDQNNRELILKAVRFYMEQKELEARKTKDGSAGPTIDGPSAPVSKDGIEDAEPAAHAADGTRGQFLENQLDAE